VYLVWIQALRLFQCAHVCRHLMVRVLVGPPRCTLCRYTTLFRSWAWRAEISRATTKRRSGARPISWTGVMMKSHHFWMPPCVGQDRKSTRLNSSHVIISYAVFCLKQNNRLEEL